MSENIENSIVIDFEGKVLEEKNPSNMFIEPVHVGQCPLCGGDTYSENDPSDDPTLSVRCCKCNWWENQFLTWEEMNCMIDDFSASNDGEGIYIDLGEPSGNDDYVSAFSSVESEKIGKCCNDGVSCDTSAYINLTFHRSTLELVKMFIGSMNREKSVEHLEENQRYIVAHGIQDFYEVICNALDKDIVAKDEYSGLTNEEEKLLKENMDN